MQYGAERFTGAPEIGTLLPREAWASQPAEGQNSSVLSERDMMHSYGYSSNPI